MSQFSFVANTAFGSAFTIGPDGINSKVTGLDGSSGPTFGVGIGMFEAFRSGKAGYDGASASAPNTIPAGVYIQGSGGIASPGSVIDQHSTTVAGVMIGKATPNATYEGVAPGARLHSVAGANCIPKISLHLD